MNLSLKTIFRKLKALAVSGSFSLYEKIKPRNTKVFVGVFLFLFVISLTIGFFVHATFMAEVVDTMGQWIGKIFAYIFYAVAHVLAVILQVIFTVVLWASSYDNLVGSQYVTKGWVLIRDLCNMGLVLILLLYAFSMILRLENKLYESNALIKILIVAVLVNFSRLFCGIVVDIAQVFMLTFVNGYAATAGANLVKGLGLEFYLTFTETNSQVATDWNDLLLVLVLAIVYLIASIIILTLIASQFLLRIAMIWILTILSPLAFLQFSGFKKIANYTGKWWTEFGNWVSMGPFLAFFLWLSLIMMSDTTAYIMEGKTGAAAVAQQGSQVAAGAVTSSHLQNLEMLAPFAISLAVLYGAYKMSKQMGGVVGNYVGAKALKVGQMASGYTALNAGRVRATKKATEYRQKKVKDIGTSVKSGLAKTSRAVGESRIGRGASGLGSAAVSLAKSPIKTMKGTVNGVKDAVRKAKSGGGGVLSMNKNNVILAAVAGAGAGMGGAAYARGKAKSGKRSMAAASSLAKERIKTQEEKMQHLADAGDPDSIAALRNTAQDEGVSDYKRAAALKLIGKKGELTAQDSGMATQILGNLSKEPGAKEEVVDAMGDKFKHLKYDFKSKSGMALWEKDLKKGKVSLGSLDGSVLKSDKAMTKARHVLGAKKFSTELEKMRETQPGASKDIGSVLAAQRGEITADLGNPDLKNVKAEDSHHMMKTEALVTKDLGKTYGSVASGVDLTDHLEELVRTHGDKVDEMGLETAAANTGDPRSQEIVATIAKNVTDRQLSTMAAKGSKATVKVIVNKKKDEYDKAVTNGDKKTMKVIVRQARKMATSPEFAGADFDKMREVAVLDVKNKITDIGTKIRGLEGQRSRTTDVDIKADIQKKLNRVNDELADLEKQEKSYT